MIQLNHELFIGNVKYCMMVITKAYKHVLCVVKDSECLNWWTNWDFKTFKVFCILHLVVYVFN